MFIYTMCLKHEIFVFYRLCNQLFSAEKFPMKIEEQKNHLLIISKDGIIGHKFQF